MYGGPEMVTISGLKMVPVLVITTGTIWYIMAPKVPAGAFN